MIKLIIFDWDDVIVLGAKDAYFRCYHETLQELDVKLNPGEEKRRILAKWGKPHREELKELLKEHPHLLDDACMSYEKKLFGSAFVDSLSVVPGIAGLLKRLSESYILCVATGQNPFILRERIVPKFMIPDVFRQIIFSYEIADSEKQKPHPYMVNKILETQGASASEALFVGDAKNDVLMARAANVEPVVVLTGHLSRPEAEKLNARYIIRDVLELETVLNEYS